MNNMFNSMISSYQQFRSNPMEVIHNTFNVPDNIDTTDPSNIIQHLYNTAQITPQQLNRANNLRNNPLIMKLLGK